MLWVPEQVILNDSEICIAANQGLIKPFNHERLSGASYDVAIHSLIKVENSDRGAHWLDHELGNDGYQLAPGEFVLAAVQEVVTVPIDMACEFRLKSSRARSGWQHNLAVWADPGYSGRLTLELSNINRHHHLKLTAGLLIGQLIFHRLTGPASRSYSVTGRYFGDIKVQESKA